MKHKRILCIFLSIALLTVGTLPCRVLGASSERYSQNDNYDNEFVPLEKSERTIQDDFSYIDVLIATNDLSQITIALYGAYYIEEIMRPYVGTSDSPCMLTVTASSDGSSITISSGGTAHITSGRITLNRVLLNESGGYLKLMINEDPEDDRNYLGNFIFSANSDGTVRVINNVPTVHYLYGIVPYEVNDLWDMEVLRSQAIASKTYAFGFTLAGEDYDITDSFNYQGYRGYKPGYDRTMKACIDTCGEMLSIDDEIVMTFYGSTNGGETELPTNAFGSGNLDYAYDMRLDDYDFEYAVDKRETLEIIYGEAPTNNKFVRLLQNEAKDVLGEDVSILAINEARATTPKFEGSVRNLTICEIDMTVQTLSDGESHDISVEFNLTELKSHGIFSRNYKIYWGEETADGYNIYFCRYGHGLGLSQTGARARAAVGHSYRQILGFYFNKMEISSVEELNPEVPYNYNCDVLAYGVVNANRVNIRSGPGTNYNSFGLITLDTHLDIVGESNGWIICIANGIMGYIRGDYVDVVLFPAPIDENLELTRAITNTVTSVYASPSEYSDSISTIRTGVEVTIRRTIGDWYYIQYGAVRGFVRKDDLNVYTILPIGIGLTDPLPFEF